MKKKPKPTKHRPAVLNQLCKLIPVGMVSSLAKEYQVDKKSRTFSPWNHVISLLYCQLTHCIGLNDLCDALCHHSAKLFAIRGATPPSRNGLSHANKNRNADMMEALFWQMLDHLQNQFPFPALVRQGATRACPAVSRRLFTVSTLPLSLWSPTAWTGQNTVGARQRSGQASPMFKPANVSTIIRRHRGGLAP